MPIHIAQTAPSSVTNGSILAADSRAATDELLAGLRRGRWRPTAWVRFLADAGRRSLAQARRRPLAVAQLTALHAVLLVAAPHRARTVTSWFLSITHLGMLGAREGIGLPNTVSLLRANLPALARTPWLGPLAIGTDLLDGCLARATCAETRFGIYADAIADATFWTTFTMRHEPAPLVRAAAAGAWVLPIVVITAVSVRGGRMVDHPRPELLRPAAAMQAVVAVRALRRESRSAGT